MILPLALLLSVAGQDSELAQREAEIAKPGKLCGVMVGSAQDQFELLKSQAGPGEIFDAGDVINIQQNNFERMWTFTKPGHPAYPAVVCSWPRQRDGKFDMGMDGRCGIDPDACIAFFTDRKRRNAELIIRLREARGEQ